ncbi:MAG: PKD domain-containing protein, partial [Clostridia bacterium]|nr:PKD domain-containing protein [Clostridia bacterium]
VKLKNAKIKYRLVGTQEWTNQKLNVSNAYINGEFDLFAYPQMDDSSNVSYGQIPEGEYEICYEAEDTYGAFVTSAVKNVILKYDDIPPTKPAVAVKEKCNTVSIILNWGVSSDNVAVDHYVIYRDGEAIGVSKENSYTDTDLSVNTEYQYTVCAIDRRGNVSTPSEAVILKTADLKISDYTQFVAEYMMEIQNNHQIPFEVKVQTDVDMSPVYVYMDYSFEDASDVVRINTVNNGNKTYRGNWPVKIDEDYLSEGNYNVIFTATDGFTSVTSDKINVKLIRDNVAPVIDNVGSPQNGFTYGGKNIPILYNVTDNVGVFRIQTEYSQDGVNYQDIFAKDYSENKSISDSFDWNAGGLLSGNYKLRISAFDKMNNRSENISDFDIDNTPPSPVSDATITGTYRNISVSWTHQNPEEGMTYKIYRSTSENGEFEEIKKQSTYKFRDDLTTILSDTFYYYKITALDKYENESEPSEVLSAKIILDTEKPTAVISPEVMLTAKDDPFLFSAVNSTDNDEIASYSWDFGDGASSIEPVIGHTYSNAGTYTVTLAVTDISGNTGVISREITVEDPYANKENYTLVTLDIVDAETSNLVPVSGATLYISYENGDNTTAISDENGKAKVFMPIGKHVVSVAAANYMPKSKNMNVVSTPDGTMDEKIGMSKTELVKGKIKTSAMSYEEILAAGINVEDPSNQHVWKFETDFIFKVGKTEYRLQNVPIGYEVESGSGSGQRTRIPARGGWYNSYGGGSSGSSGSGSGGSGSTPRFGIFPTEVEGYYLVIYGETHWLKEMYNVELLVTNDSYLDTVENCVAELELPDGLSLASMLDRQQSSTITIGNIDVHSDGVAQWFVRGDAEGEYDISAKVSGDLVSGSITEPFIYRFRTSSPVKVYAGSALKMTVTANDYAVVNRYYPVVYRLENVSDKTLYNLSFAITGIREGKLLRIKKGNRAGELIQEETYSKDFEDELTQSVEKLEPGEYIECQVNVVCWFKSEEELQFDKIFWGADQSRYGIIDISESIGKFGVETREGSSTVIPSEVVIVTAEKNPNVQH